MADTFLQRVKGNILTLCEGDKSAYKRIKAFILKFGDGSSFKVTDTVSFIDINRAIDNYKFSLFVEQDTASLLQTTNILVGTEQQAHSGGGGGGGGLHFAYYTLEELVAHDFDHSKLKRRYCQTAYCITVQDLEVPAKNKGKEVAGGSPFAPRTPIVDPGRPRAAVAKPTAAVAEPSAATVAVADKPATSTVAAEPSTATAVATGMLFFWWFFRLGFSMSCSFSGKRKQDNDHYTNMLLKFPKYSDDTTTEIVKGTIIEYDDRKKMCKINLDDEDDVLNLPLEKVHSLIKQYNFYSAAGIIYNTCAVLIKDMSPCVVNTLVCATSKINYILVATTCEFNKMGFSFDGEQVGDSIILNKNNFEKNCAELDFEAIACDEKNNIYVSSYVLFFRFCLF